MALFCKKIPEMWSCFLVSFQESFAQIWQQIFSNFFVFFKDINKAAEEISTLHKLDVMKIRMELLEEWLQPENFIADVSCDETMIKQHQVDGVIEARFSDVEYQNFQR